MNPSQNPPAEIANTLAADIRAEIARLRADAPSDPIMLSTALMQLAKQLKLRNERIESESLFREALAIRRTACTGDEVRIAIAATFLARFLEETDRIEESEPLYREALAIFRTTLPAGHPHLGLSLRNLAAALDELKGEARLIEAEQLLREALQLTRVEINGDPQALAGALSDLGAHLSDRGLLTEADPLLNESLDRYRGAPQMSEQDLSYTLARIARLRLAQGRLAEAECAARETLALREKGHPTTDHRVAKAKSLLGLCLVRLNRLDEAQALLTEALDVLENTPCAIGACPSRITETRHRLAQLHAAQSATAC